MNSQLNNSHLTKDEINNALLGLSDPGSTEDGHLRACEQCAAEVERSRALLADFGRAARQEAERDQNFWARQRLVIASRVEHSARRWALTVVWGAVAATAAVAVLWIASTQTPEKPAPSPESPVVAGYQQNDELLLKHVEAALEQGTPRALAPAEVLTSELNRSAAARNKQSRSEKR
jgi:anti-sigma-K factor RskA